jgi:hypothetical protein
MDDQHVHAVCRRVPRSVAAFSEIPPGRAPRHHALRVRWDARRGDGCDSCSAAELNGSDFSVALPAAGRLLPISTSTRRTVAHSPSHLLGNTAADRERLRRLVFTTTRGTSTIALRAGRGQPPAEFVIGS